MVARRSALDAMADLPVNTSSGPPFSRIRIDLDYYVAGHDSSLKSPALARAVTERLIRDDITAGGGAAVVSGLANHFDIPRARVFHESLFRQVWQEMSHRAGYIYEDGSYPIKTKIVSDGAIRPELYGSAWSFKQLHIDRDALLFSHLYGPISGFTGGELVLVDVRAYMQSQRLRFKDAFLWSDEPTDGSKPVLRQEHVDAALEGFGINLGTVGPNELIFVNNAPEAGILHGVFPLSVTDQSSFVRQFHRCSVKDSRNG